MGNHLIKLKELYFIPECIKHTYFKLYMLYSCICLCHIYSMKYMCIYLYVGVYVYMYIYEKRFNYFGDLFISHILSDITTANSG